MHTTSTTYANTYLVKPSGFLFCLLAPWLLQGTAPKRVLVLGAQQEAHAIMRHLQGDRTLQGGYERLDSGWQVIDGTTSKIRAHQGRYEGLLLVLPSAPEQITPFLEAQADALDRALGCKRERWLRQAIYVYACTDGSGLPEALNSSWATFSSFPSFSSMNAWSSFSSHRPQEDDSSQEEECPATSLKPDDQVVAFAGEIQPKAILGINPHEGAAPRDGWSSTFTHYLPGLRTTREQLFILLDENYQESPSGLFTFSPAGQVSRSTSGALLKNALAACLLFLVVCLGLYQGIEEDEGAPDPAL